MISKGNAQFNAIYSISVCEKTAVYLEDNMQLGALKPLDGNVNSGLLLETRW